MRLAREAWYSSYKYLESQKKKLTKKCKNCNSENCPRLVEHNGSSFKVYYCTSKDILIYEYFDQNYFDGMSNALVLIQISSIIIGMSNAFHNYFASRQVFFHKSINHVKHKYQPYLFESELFDSVSVFIK